MSSVDLTDLIERLDAYEEAVDVRFEGLSAFVEPGFLGDTAQFGWNVSVRGEVHAVSGEQLTRDVAVTAALYDVNGHVVDSLSSRISRDSFFVLEPFELSQDSVPTNAISRILIYPLGLR